MSTQWYPSSDDALFCFFAIAYFLSTFSFLFGYVFRFLNWVRFFRMLSSCTLMRGAVRIDCSDNDTLSFPLSFLFLPLCLSSSLFYGTLELTELLCDS